MDVLGHGLARRTMARMRMGAQVWLGLQLLIAFSALLLEKPFVWGQPLTRPDGNQAFVVLTNQKPQDLIPPEVRPLLLPEEQEQFLQEFSGQASFANIYQNIRDFPLP